MTAWKAAALKVWSADLCLCLMVLSGLFCFLFFLKFWDYRQPRKYLNILPCQVPVWKARYTVSEKHPPAPLMLWEQNHEGMLNKELLQCFSPLLLDVKLILKSLMVLTRPRKVMSAMGAFRRRNHWQCEIPVFGIILLGMKLRCEWLALGAGGLESSCCSRCPVFSLMSSTGTCSTDVCPVWGLSLLPRSLVVAHWALTACQIQEVVLFDRANTQLCEAKVLQISHTCSLLWTSEYVLK